MPTVSLTEAKRPKRGETAIAALPLPDKGTIDYFDQDRPGFAVRASYGGARTFVHYHRIDGKLRRRRLGSWPAMTLAEARGAYRSDRELLDKGIDPEGERRKLRDDATAERDAAKTFREAVEGEKGYHRRYLVGEAANKSADATRDALLKECATWADRRVDSITAREIGALVEGIRDGGRRIWANRVYAFLRHFFGWCARPTVGYVERSPMHGMTRPTREEKTRDRWFDADEIGTLWRAASGLGIYEAAYVRILLLTGKRKNALAAMRRDEIGTDGWWRPTGASLPPAKKLNQPIPLPTAALRIVRNLPQLDDNPHMFPGRRKDGHLDPGSPLTRKIQSASGIADFYPHACRHTISTLLSRLRVPGNAARRYTDHAQVGDAHEKVYSHDDLEEVVEDAAEAWGRYVTLAARRRVWAKVSAYLDAADVPEGDGRRKAHRDRMRNFCGLIQTGGEQWIQWVRSITRPRAETGNVVPIKALRGKK